MTKTFLKHDSPEDFVDFPEPKEVPPGKVRCKKCKGHGGWNLELNAYSLRDNPDTVENRHRYSHFRASCSACWGWGVIGPDQQCPKGEPGEGHVYTGKEEKIRMCLTNWICDRCGHKEEVDSSD